MIRQPMVGKEVGKKKRFSLAGLSSFLFSTIMPCGKKISLAFQR